MDMTKTDEADSPDTMSAINPNTAPLSDKNISDDEKAKAKKAALNKRIANLAKVRGKRKRGAPKLGRHIHGENKISNFDHATARQAIGIPNANNQQIISVLDPPRPYQSREDMGKTIAKGGRAEKKLHSMLAKETGRNASLQKQIVKGKARTAKHKREKQEWMVQSRRRIKILRQDRASLLIELCGHQKRSNDHSKSVMDNAESIINEAKAILLKAHGEEARAVDAIAASQIKHDVAIVNERNTSTKKVREGRKITNRQNALLQSKHDKVTEKMKVDHAADLLTMKAEYDKDIARLEKRLTASLDQIQKERLMWQVLEHQMNKSLEKESLKLSAEKKRHRCIINNQLDKYQERETDIMRKIEQLASEKYELNKDLMSKRRECRLLKKKLKNAKAVSASRMEKLRVSKVRSYDGMITINN